METTIRELINKALKELGLEVKKFNIEHPVNLEFGDYSTNVGIITGKADEIVEALRQSQGDFIDKIEVKGGFINFYLSKKFFAKSLEEIIDAGENFGRLERLKGEKVMVEYTDPNPFKEFHIGHLMSNAIGETVSRILDWNGAEVKRACYQGDVGLHVAKAVWARSKEQGVGSKSWGEYYSEGAKAYEADENAKQEITEINKKIYDKSDVEVNELYESGKKVSLEYFDAIYAKLGTKFDYFIMESEAAPVGEKIVRENVGKVFEESDGAVVFHAEKYDPKLHTRVFINSEGLPTYEAKDLGNAKLKSEIYPYTRSVVITGNEVTDYFKVMLAAMKLVLPKLAEETKHLPHGMLRLPTGKMSSRTGDVITAESLIEEVKKAISAKGQEATDDIAVGAIKYTVLKQGIGNDIVFDFDKSVSTEGDSGVYLQYAYARTNSVLEKASAQGRNLNTDYQGSTSRTIEKLLYRFPEIVERAGEEYAPQYITTYLIELSGAFNHFYAQEQIVSDEPESSYRLAIARAFNIVIKNGLNILGIPTPERI